MPHTPGPWVIGDVQWIMHQKSGIGYSYRPINSGALEVAQVWEDDQDCEMEDNVRLIAAAPELLAAIRLCKQALKNYIDSGYDEEEDQEAYVAAMKAIAKAEGRVE